MSSRLMPAKTGAIAWTIRTISIGVLRIQADGERVDVGEPLEQCGLAFHDRQCRQRSQVAEPEHSGAIGDDGDGVALDRQPTRVLGVLGNGQAHASNAGGIDQGEIVAITDWHLRANLELATEVHEEGAVADVADRHALDRPQRLSELVRMRCRRRCARDVDADAVVPGAGHIQRSDQPAGLFHGCRQLANRRATGGNLEPDGDRIGHAGNAGHGPTPSDDRAATRCDGSSHRCSLRASVQLDRRAKAHRPAGQQRVTLDPMTGQLRFGRPRPAHVRRPEGTLG